MLSFSVIIVSWNALDHLQTFLPSVVNSRYEDFEILLADNNSTDGSGRWVKKNYPHVKVISLDKNYGYCGGNNRAARHATGDVLLFLNNDVEVEPDWLTRLNECFGAHPDWSVIQPKILSYEYRDCFEYAGAGGGYIDKYGYPFCRGRIFDTVEKDTGQYDTAVNIFWASGAAFAIRTESFFELDGFDEDFEFHMEEIDLCWRLWNRGHKAGFCPDSVVYHLGGGSLPMGSPRKVYYNYRNSLIMLLKNYSGLSLWSRLPFRILLDYISALKLLFEGNFKEFWAIKKAHIHFLSKIPETLKKRKKILTNRTSAINPNVMASISVVWSYFIEGVREFKNLRL